MLNLKRFPREVRYGLGLLLTGWAGHFVFLSLVFVVGRETPENKILYQQVAIAAVLGYFLYHGKKWARMLCLLCNSLIIVLYLTFGVLFWSSHPPMRLLALGVVGCFSAATFFLITRQAKLFYAGPGDQAQTGTDR